jgi:hypothetical protein
MVFVRFMVFVRRDSVNPGSRPQRRGEAGRVRAGSAPCALLCPSGNLICAFVRDLGFLWRGVQDAFVFARREELWCTLLALMEGRIGRRRSP